MAHYNRKLKRSNNVMKTSHDYDSKGPNATAVGDHGSDDDV